MSPIDSNSSKKSNLNPAPTLFVYEWLAVISVVGFLFILTLIVVCKGPLDIKKEGDPHYLKAQSVDIYIDGAVAKPGKYQVKVGSLLKDVIALAEPTADADLRKLRLSSKARNGQNYTVPSKPTIRVFISGAVTNEGPVVVPKGTRLFEIAEYISLNPNADLKKINRKRILKDNERLEIPAAPDFYALPSVP